MVGMAINNHKKKKKKKKKIKEASNDVVDASLPLPLPLPHPPPTTLCFDGENLVRLLHSIQRKVESARTLNATLPLKFWLKQQFSIGVNDVTRTLQRMPPLPFAASSANKPPFHLQAILLATDCYPRSLTRHLPTLAFSRKVPLIFVKDTKGGSVKLGELVKLKTAIAVGVKAKINDISLFMEEIISGNEVSSDANT